MDATEPLINAGGMAAFGRRNLILTGPGGRDTPVVTFAGPLSIKGVLEGRIDWRTREARFRVSPDTFVLLNDGQEYQLSTEDDGPCRTFCVFFEAGFVEQAARALSRTDEALLDDPQAPFGFGFHEALTPISSLAGRSLQRLMRAVAEKAAGDDLDWLFHRLAEDLAGAALQDRRRPERLAAVRASTRREIHRRLLRARAAAEDDLSAPWTLRRLAAEAAMAPHHFARSFRQCFGEAPRQFLKRRRMERAQALLRSRRFSVTDTCLEVGYQSLGSFSAAYRRHHGVPPSHGR